MQYALKKNVAIVLTTRIYHGGAFPIYGDQGGGRTMQEAGVVMGGNLTGPKARILLIMALPEVKGDNAKLQKYFKY